MVKKGKQFRGFGWLWLPTEGWKETAPWAKKFRFSVKVNIYLKLKMWRLKTRAPQAEIDEFFKTCFLKWENGRRMNWPPPKKYNSLPLIGQPPPLKSKKNWPPQKPKIPKFQLPSLTLAGVAHYVTVRCWLHSIVWLKWKWNC